MSKSCGKCGKLGHNSRTCGRKLTVKVSGHRVCSNCGIAGHNIRTCPGIHCIPVKKESKKGVRICGHCGEPGHNRRTCLKLGYKGITEQVKDKLVKTVTNFKSESEFLKFVYPDTKICDALQDPKLYPHVLITIHYTVGLKNVKVECRGIYILVKKNKFIELRELGDCEYMIRKGNYEGKSNTKRKFTMTLSKDIRSRLDAYSKKYDLVYGG